MIFATIVLFPAGVGWVRWGQITGEQLVDLRGECTVGGLRAVEIRMRQLLLECLESGEFLRAGDGEGVLPFGFRPCRVRFGKDLPEVGFTLGWGVWWMVSSARVMAQAR